MRFIIWCVSQQRCWWISKWGLRERLQERRLANNLKVRVRPTVGWRVGARWTEEQRRREEKRRGTWREAARSSSSGESKTFKYNAEVEEEDEVRDHQNQRMKGGHFLGNHFNMMRTMLMIIRRNKGRGVGKSERMDFRVMRFLWITEESEMRYLLRWWVFTWRLTLNRKVGLTNKSQSAAVDVTSSGAHGNVCVTRTDVCVIDRCSQARDWPSCR